LADGWARAFGAAADRLGAAGAVLVPVDPAPFDTVAAMLYEGAFVAERYAAVGEFVDKGGPGLDAVVAGIIGAARDLPAHRLYADLAELARLREAALAELGDADALLLPTTTFHPTLAEVAADPVGVNTRLGRFTNSANLLGLCALAVPAGTVAGLPFGVTLVGPPDTEEGLAAIARLLVEPPVRLAVFGAHLTGQPLNGQLSALGGRFTADIATAPTYRLYALPTEPAKPGLVRVAQDGATIAGELWELPAAGLGALLAALPRPMALGPVELADGRQVTGFLCEPAALAGARDITATGGWAAHLRD
ncbi:amidase family protein, partial [Kitasatospora paranensis]